MKKTISCTGLLIVISLLFTTCRKIDWTNIVHGPGKRDCNLVAYTLHVGADVPQPFLFSKQYNSAGDLTAIDARFNNLLAVEDLFHYRLRIVHDNKKVYLVNQDSPYDTKMTLFFNSHGRVEKAIGDDVLYSYEFNYKQNRLFSIKWYYHSGLVFIDTCRYDAKGNILSITHPEPSLNDRIGYFYEYDYSKKAKYQFYMEETRNLHNGFTLLQYLDLFPELAPVNLRTRARNGTENSYYIWQQWMINHQVDAKGRLTGYDVVDIYNGQTYPNFPVTLNWDCGNSD
jgi:hypothetical protein